jgi:protein SCO1
MLRNTVIALFLLLASLAVAQGGALAGVGGGTGISRNADLAGVGLENKLGTRIPIDVELKNDKGQTIKTGQLLRGRPIVLLPIFYRCANVCTIEMQGVLSALSRNPKLTPGKDFDLVVLGLNPKEPPELAAAKKAQYIEQDGRKETANAWTFLTGPEAETQKVAKAMGFKYTYDAAKDRVNHPSGVIILTPEGRVSAVMTKGMYPAARFAEDVQRAAKEQIGEEGELSWFGCLHTDPVTGKRSVVVQGVMRLFGIVTVLGLLGTMIVLGRRKAK